MNHAGHQGSGPVPREILERPVPLRQGIGTVHEKVTTSSPEAQAFYDQGLAYLHSYVWIDIGLHDVTTAHAAFQRAQELGQRASERERTWITIRERELAYLEDSGSPDTYVEYRQALKDAIKRNPNDPWLWIQRGLADEGSPLTHGQAGGVDTLAFYKTALALAPDNFVAHHYYAHTYENIGRTKEALDESATYVRMAPVIPL